MDRGTATLDALYAPYQQAIDARFVTNGWVKGMDWESRIYPGAEHEENAWATRLPEVLGWLLAKRAAKRPETAFQNDWQSGRLAASPERHRPAVSAIGLALPRAARTVTPR
jgi:hypothetical protein